MAEKNCIYIRKHGHQIKILIFFRQRKKKSKISQADRAKYTFYYQRFNLLMNFPVKIEKPIKRSDTKGRHYTYTSKLYIAEAVYEGTYII